MSINYTKFTRMVPKLNNSLSWYEEFIKHYKRYSVDTNNRIAAFIAQCAHESNDFTILQENLNYSANRLMEVWPSRFPNSSIANKYAHNPQKLANYVYANRLGNGSEESGDGWIHAGKGVIQLTGKENYQEFAEHINKPLEEIPEFLLTVEGAMLSAFFFWHKHDLNALADKKNLIGMTKVINGGTHGLDDRIRKFLKNLKIMNEV